MTLGLDKLQYYKEFPEIVFAVNEDGYFINKKDVVKLCDFLIENKNNMRKFIGYEVLFAKFIKNASFIDKIGLSGTVSCNIDKKIHDW